MSAGKKKKRRSKLGHRLVLDYLRFGKKGWEFQFHCSIEKIPHHGSNFSSKHSRKEMMKIIRWLFRKDHKNK